MDDATSEALVVSMLRAFPDDASIQALRALRAVVAANRGSQIAALQLWERLHAAHVSEAIVAALRVDVTQPGLQMVGTGAVSTLAQCLGGTPAVQQLLDAGAGDVLIKVLAASTAAYICAAATLSALAMLARNGGGAASERLLAAGADEAIMAAVAKHCEIEEGGTARRAHVLWSAASAVAALAAHSPANGARFCAAGAAAAAVRAVQLSLDAQEAQQLDGTAHLLRDFGLEAIGALAAAGDAARSGSEPGSESVALVEAGAREAATAALNALLAEPCGTIYGVDDKSLLWALHAIYQRADAEQSIDAVLECAAADAAAVEARLVAAGACEAVLGVMNVLVKPRPVPSWHFNDSALRAAVDAVAALSGGAAAAARLRAIGAGDAVAAAAAMSRCAEGSLLGSTAQLARLRLTAAPPPPAGSDRDSAA
ncbi:hypothetical protein JKP88DRAFT_275082 [Tribonema minus]|uniref:Uncharacterized protein n=1 Tax=Tribonema minus TaxID=303371 RepID=A0A835ZGT2_9STRA|nr:hypothetical protein JKP88DRAFT_275082 [Tribonema minus]